MEYCAQNNLFLFSLLVAETLKYYKVSVDVNLYVIYAKVATIFFMNLNSTQ